MAIYIALMVVLLPAWIDYARVLLNYRSSPALYDVPLVLILLVAWFGGRRRRSRVSGKTARRHRARLPDVAIIPGTLGGTDVPCVRCTRPASVARPGRSRPGPRDVPPPAP